MKFILPILLGVFVLLAPLTVAKTPLILSAVRPLLIDVPDPTHEETSLAPAELSVEQLTIQALRIGCTVGLVNKHMGFWLGAYHCANHKFAMKIGGDKGLDAYGLIADPDNDLVLFHTGTLDLYSDIRELRLAKHAPRWGDILTVAGYPYGLGPFIVWGPVSNPSYALPGETQLRIIYSLAACPGNSGSPVVNSHDEIVSVHQIGIERGCVPLKGGASYEAVKALITPYLGSK